MNATDSDQPRWNKGHLFAALDTYQSWLPTRGLTVTSVESEWRYAERFVRWLYAEYASRGCQPRGDPVPATRCLTITDLYRVLDGYRAYLHSCGLSPGGIPTYVIQAGLFVKWLPSSKVRGCSGA